MNRAGVGGLLLVLAGTAAAPAGAQVTVNPGALDAAPARPAPTAKPAPRPAAAARPAGPNNPPVPASRAAVRVAPPAAPPPNAPPGPVIPPAVVVPLARLAPPPPVPVNGDAPGVASPLPAGGVRVTFGPDRQDFNPDTAQAIRAYGATVRENDSAALNVMAYAAARTDDQSTSRRLSLARALAARAVLIAEGLPSTRIYVRALGASAGDGPPDRVDVMPAAAATPAPTLTAAPPAADPAPPPAPNPAPRPAPGAARR